MQPDNRVVEVDLRHLWLDSRQPHTKHHAIHSSNGAPVSLGVIRAVGDDEPAGHHHTAHRLNEEPTDHHILARLSLNEQLNGASGLVEEPGNGQPQHHRRDKETAPASLPSLRAVAGIHRLPPEDNRDAREDAAVRERATGFEPATTSLGSSDSTN